MRPDAIYATLDRLALGALLAARSRGLTVPNELLIAGLTDSAAARGTAPPLTTLNLHPEEIGRKAIEMLVALVEGNPPEQPHQFVRTRVVPRDSSVRTRGRLGSRRSVP